MISYFKGSFIFTFLSIIAAVFLGLKDGGGSQGVISAVVIVLALAVLEVSLSFENAVVNAKYLKNMSELWQKRFLTWGMVIAVFGMRIFFPILIVAVAIKTSLLETLFLAINNPKGYEEALTSVHHEILAFGGIFLLMVALRYFFDKEKDVHWVQIIESPLVKAGKLYMAEALLAMVTLVSISMYTPPKEQFNVLIAGLFGLIVYIVVQWTEVILGDNSNSTSVVKTGISSFIYLEVLDASFSFDGVVGAFALSNNIFIIALGLGIGSMFVRSLTIYFVENETLDAFKFLEHGAFWAVFFLSSCMLLGLFVQVPEIITGLSGAILIGLSLFSSYIHKNKMEAVKVYK